MASGDKAPEASKYYGGELRKERSSELTTVAVAMESSGLNKEKDALAYAVLQRAVGSGSRVKWGTSVSPLQKQVSSAASADQFAVSSFNASYSDSGLFGFVVCSIPSVAGSVSSPLFSKIQDKMSNSQQSICFKYFCTDFIRC